MTTNDIIDMSTNLFPFGHSEEQKERSKKILIRKRIHYMNEKERAILEQKINILKNIYHKNAINFREVEDNNDGTIDIYYNYVPYSLEKFFNSCDYQTKQILQKQLIKLVIHLAKNCILTSFYSNRCGVILNADNKWQVKYYLPLDEIIITDDKVVLKRFVELFTVQSLHFLDLLCQFSDNKTDAKYNCRDSQYSIKHERRESQPYTKSLQKERRFSNQASLLKFSRKLSNSRQKTQFSGKSFKHTNASTLFQTLRQSNSTAGQVAGQVNKSESSIMNLIQLKQSKAILQQAKRTNSRSRKVLKKFNSIIKSLRVFDAIKVKANELKM